MFDASSYLVISSASRAGVKPAWQNLLEFFGLIIIFIVVLVACWATTRFVASKQLIQKNMGNFEVIETYSIARDRFLQLVRIGKRYFVLSVSKDSINVISEIPKEELNLDKKTGSTAVNGFSNVLDSLLKKSSKKDFSENESDNKSE